MWKPDPVKASLYIRVLIVTLYLGISYIFSAHQTTIHAQASDEKISITGYVTNATPDGKLPDELVIFLLVIDQNAESIIERIETSTNPDGSFSVDAPAIQDGQFYRVVADDGVYTPYFDILPDAVNEEVIITIFDKTTSLEQISFGSYAMVIPVIDQANKEVAVLTSVRLINSGNQVYLADLEDPNLTGLNLLRFNLPEGYKQLSVESDLPSGNVMEINTGFALSNPVPPGEYNILMSYTAPYQNDTFSFPLRLPFGSENVSILLPEGDTNLNGKGMTKGETVEINNSPYIQYEGTNYERGSQLDVAISGLPRPSTTQQFIDFFSSTQFQVALVASVALALIITVIGISMGIFRRNKVTVESANTPQNTADSSRTHLIRSIAELDDLHDSGQIGEADYVAQRRELIQQAITLDETDKASK